MSGTRERNERLLRAGIEAFNRGDRDTLLAMFDPGIECHVAPGQGNPGTWVGREGFEAMTGTWGEAFSTQESSVVSTSFPDEHHLIAEIHQRAVGAASGVPVEMTNFYLLEVRDGRAVRFHIYPDRQSAMNAVR
jgi:ketosteroid isomerase-like protein